MESRPTRVDQLTDDPASFVTNAIKAYVATSINNRLPSFPGEVIWDEPLIGFADGDDPFFQQYKRIIGDFHVTPREALEMHLKGTAWSDSHPPKVSVISWILPSTAATRRSQRQQTAVCSLRWNYARWYGQDLIFRLSRHLVSRLEDMGYHAVAPELEPWFEVKREVANGPASRWSQRHVAHAAGLGTFGLNDGLITRRGIAVRIGSVVCNLPIPASPRAYTSHTANCLFYRESSCGSCIKRCPAGAISERGHDKAMCADYLRNTMPKILKGEARGTDYVGPYPACGLCQTGVPCESRIPPGKDRRRQPLDKSRTPKDSASSLAGSCCRPPGASG